MTTIDSPLKYHGGKSYLRNWILGLFPPRDQYLTYVEACFGGGSVLLGHDPTDKAEVANDLDGLLTNFWGVLADPGCFATFQRMCEATPFSRPAWERAKELLDRYDHVPPDAEDDEQRIECAWAYFVAMRQGMAGRSDNFAPLSTNRLRRGMNEQASAWLGVVDGLPEVHQRMRRVVVERLDVVQLLHKYDKPGVTCYVDPPYFPATRACPEAYRHDMTAADHDRFLRAVASVKSAYVLVSGYDCREYGEALGGWEKETRTIDNKAAKGEAKRKMTEVVWRNFNAAGELLSGGVG